MKKDEEFLEKKSFFNFNNLIDPKILKFISNVRFYYVGFHNITFKGKYDNSDVQIRIPLSDLVDTQNERKVYRNLGNSFYYHKGVLIKYWVKGKNLENTKVSKEVKLKIIEAVKDLHKKSIVLKKFDWLYYGTDDSKFLELVKKYKKVPLVVSHCDLNGKNIIFDEHRIRFIDFEWMTLAPRHFDAITIMKNFEIDRKLIKKEFLISDEELDDFEYMFDTFNKDAYKKVYDERKMLNNRLNGQTNETYRMGKYVIQHKVKNKFNHKFSLSIIPKSSFVVPILYEDDKIIITEYVENCKTEINDEFLAKLALVVRRMHRLKVNLPKNTINKQLNYFLENTKEKRKAINIDNYFIEIMLNISKKINHSYFSHNDLSMENILVDKNGEIKIVDFEYASFGNTHFDLAYFIESSHLDEKQADLFLKTYHKGYYGREKMRWFRLLVNLYGLLWSLNYEDNPNIISYNLKRIEELQKYINLEKADTIF